MAFLADTLVTSNWRNDHVGYMLLRVSGKTTRIPINIPNHPGFASGLVSIWYVLLKQGNERFCWKRLVLAKRCTHRVLHLHGGVEVNKLHTEPLRWHASSFLLWAWGCNWWQRDKERLVTTMASFLFSDHLFRPLQRRSWGEQPWTSMCTFMPCC